MHLRVDGNRASVLGSLAQPQLASDFIQFLGVDSRQRLWIGTDNGVNVVAGGKVFYLSQQDGLIWNVCSGNSFLAGKDGLLCGWERVWGSRTCRIRVRC